MIQYLLFGTSKLLNISDITKRIGNFFKLPIQLSWGIAYPELAYLGYDCLGRLVRIGDRFDRVAKLFNYNYGIIGE
ncbi:MAG: hypothetical protein ACI30D_02645 [Muribaculaceae bacterium]